MLQDLTPMSDPYVGSSEYLHAQPGVMGEYPCEARSTQLDWYVASGILLYRYAGSGVPALHAVMAGYLASPYVR